MKPIYSLLSTGCLLLVAPAASAQDRIDSPASTLAYMADVLTPSAEDELRAQFEASQSGDPGALPLLAQSHLLAGQPISVGPLYKATYDVNGVRFVPLLGREAPKTRSLTFQFQSAEVGQQPIVGLDLAALPVLENGEVVFERGAGVSEVYQAHNEGLEQLFRFESLPSRDGDLVVRGTFTTDLFDTGATGRSLRFEEPGIASITLDKVIGIDANGQRVDGQLRRLGDQLEIRLPHSFLRDAAFPLTLDPLFGVELQATNVTFDSDQVDVAFGSSFYDEYALVFCRYFSATDPDIYATTHTNSGAPGLLLFAIESVINTFDQAPTIAYNIGATTFAVAWQRSSAPGLQNDVLLASFDALSGAVSSSISIASSSLDESEPDLGGEELSAYDRVVLVYNSNQDIRVASVRVSNLGTPVSLSNKLIPTMVNNSRRPAITKSGGAPGQYLVVCEAVYDIDSDLQFATVDYLGFVLSGAAALVTVGPDEERPDVAGNGTDFMVVFEREPFANSGDNDIWARKLSYVSSTPSLDNTTIVVAGDVSDDEIEPAIGLSGNEYLIAYADQFLGSSLYDIYAATISTKTCKLCEPSTLVSSPTGTNRAPQVGSRAAGGDTTADQAAIAFTRSIAGNGKIYFHLWENEGSGSVASNMGGGCGGGGFTSFLGSTAIGSSDLSSTLTGVDSAASLAILNINVPGGEFGCGPCTVLPFQYLFVRPTFPGAGGDKQAVQPLSIPCKPGLAGKTIAFQWTSVFTGASPCSLSPNISLSNRQHLTLGF